MHAFQEVREHIGNKKFIVSFDFDGLDAQCFKDVWVPEQNGLSIDFTRDFVNEFSDAIGFEFVEWAVSGDKHCEDIARDLITIVAKKFN